MTETLSDRNSHDGSCQHFPLSCPVISYLLPWLYDLDVPVAFLGTSVSRTIPKCQCIDRCLWVTNEISRTDLGSGWPPCSLATPPSSNSMRFVPSIPVVGTGSDFSCLRLKSTNSETRMFNPWFATGFSKTDRNGSDPSRFECFVRNFNHCHVYRYCFCTRKP